MNYFAISKHDGGGERIERRFERLCPVKVLRTDGSPGAARDYFVVKFDEIDFSAALDFEKTLFFPFKSAVNSKKIKHYAFRDDFDCDFFSCRGYIMGVSMFMVRSSFGGDRRAKIFVALSGWRSMQKHRALFRRFKAASAGVVSMLRLLMDQETKYDSETFFRIS